MITVSNSYNNAADNIINGIPVYLELQGLLNLKLPFYKTKHNIAWIFVKYE